MSEKEISLETLEVSDICPTSEIAKAIQRPAPKAKKRKKPPVKECFVNIKPANYKDRRPGNGDTVQFGAEKFVAVKRAFNSCEGCEAPDYCKQVYEYYATLHLMGCQNVIFKKKE